jgi:hypothetical protein
MECPREITEKSALKILIKTYTVVELKGIAR